MWAKLGRMLGRHSRWVLGGAVVLTLVLAGGLPRLQFSSSQDSLVPSDSPILKENQAYQQQFGGEPVLVLFTGDIGRLTEPRNVRALDELENALNRDHRYQSVLTPLTTLRFAAAQTDVAAQLVLNAQARAEQAAAQAARVDQAHAGASASQQDQAARRASDQAAAPFTARIQDEATRLTAAGEQTLSNPAFVDFLLQDANGRIRSAFRSQFPDAHHALMVVRLSGNTTIDAQGQAAQHVVDLARAHPIDGLKVLPTGPAILLKEVNDGMRQAMARMGLLAVVAMALVLILVLRLRWRLLSLAMVVVGCIWAFGLLGYLGLTLTMVTIAALPVLIGLGVDFAIQTHSRFEEEEARGSEAGRALSDMMSSLGLPLTVAMVAAIAGFLSLRLSPVPMIRDFGLMLAVGVAGLFGASLVLTATVLYQRDVRPRPARKRRHLVPESHSGIERGVQFLTTASRGYVLPVVLATVVIASVGLVLDRGTTIQSDPEKFIPQNSPVLADLRHIRDVAGSSAELDFLVRASDVTRPATVAWMANFEAQALAHHPHELLSSASMASIAQQVTGAAPTPLDVQTVLRVAPPAIPQTFVSSNHREAHIIFNISNISLLQQKKLLAAMNADLHPPPGVNVTPGGLAIVGIAAVDALNANRTIMVYLALGAVFLWLLVFTRSVAWALLPIMPVLVAVGTASIAIRVLGVNLSPLSAVSGPIIVATCTEFSVLVMARYIEERQRGRDEGAALHHAVLRIGQAFAASGLTVVGGFGALAFSGFPLLNSFGVVVAVNVAVALVSSLIVLPPLLVRLDKRAGLQRINQHLYLAPIQPARTEEPTDTTVLA
jgi:uncharacterized protein